MLRIPPQTQPIAARGVDYFALVELEDHPRPAAWPPQQVEGPRAWARQAWALDGGRGHEAVLEWVDTSASS